jgi:hypothetical protein
MLEGWRNQQLSRNLDHGTIDARIRLVQRFLEHPRKRRTVNKTEAAPNPRASTWHSEPDSGPTASEQRTLFSRSITFASADLTRMRA